MHMLMFVLDNPDYLDEVLQAWEDIGVSGVTIIESTGISRYRETKLVGTPLMAGINRILHSNEEGHLTLFTIVKGESNVRQCIGAVEEIVGNLMNPNTGVLAAWPLTIVKGVPDPSLNTEAA
jgi:nitrogen regulatory protein PII